MNRNFDLRRSTFGDECLGALNLERVGTASKYTGSGGAVVVFCPNGPSQVKLLEDACQKAGFVNIVSDLFSMLFLIVHSCAEYYKIIHKIEFEFLSNHFT